MWLNQIAIINDYYRYEHTLDGLGNNVNVWLKNNQHHKIDKINYFISEYKKEYSHTYNRFIAIIEYQEYQEQADG